MAAGIAAIAAYFGATAATASAIGTGVAVAAGAASVAAAGLSIANALNTPDPLNPGQFLKPPDVNLQDQQEAANKAVGGRRAADSAANVLTGGAANVTKSAAAQLLGQ